MISTKSFKKETQYTDKLDIQKAYQKRQLWSLIRPGTTHLVLKHLYHSSNFLPLFIALIRGIRPIVMIQKVEYADRWWMKLFLRCVPFVLFATRGTLFAVTTQGRDELSKYVPLVTYIPPCIDPDRFVTKSYQEARIDTLQLIAVAKYQDVKNLPLLIKAVGNICASHPQLKLHLTVIGAIAQEPEYRRVGRLVAKLGLQKKVTLSTAVPPMLVPDRLAHADVLVLPSNREALGYAVLEGMAAGLPVIVSSAVGASSCVEHGHNGYVFANNSLSGLTTALESFLTSQGMVDVVKLSTFGQVSRTLVEQRHAPSVFGKKFWDLIEPEATR